MPPKTRRATNQENATAMAAPPPPLAKRKLDESSPKPTRVLQDITARFVAPDSKVATSAAEPLPRPRLKRKAKAPIGQLAKRRALGKASTHHPAIPSSLPPSSPPSESSRFEVLNADGEVTAAAPRITTSALDQASVYGDENLNPLEDDFDGPSDRQPLQFHTQRVTAKDADPFGFFAVESQLKAQREANPLSREPHLHADGSHRILSDLDIPVDDDHPTPYPDTLEDDHDENVPPLMPSTPHKRKKRKPSASPSFSGEELFSPSPGSAPSTPSPSKRRASKVHGPQNTTDISDGELTLTRPFNVRAGTKRQGKQEKPTTRKKARVEDTTISPRKLAEDLESLLPKRSSRLRAARSKASAKGKGKAKQIQEDSGDETEHVSKKTTSRKKAASDTKPRSKAGKGKGKFTSDADGEEIDVDDIKEKQAAERRARLEYFKKLESYKVEEENVYVI